MHFPSVPDDRTRPSVPDDRLNRVAPRWRPRGATGSGMKAIDDGDRPDYQHLNTARTREGAAKSVKSEAASHPAQDRKPSP
ncbi:hypothetical protein DdX_05711 [Ditylenchus destructor]|uniref:Uncharacterized protein n=1 Tax=Ditylenchus destructor TaxID=166010 RepID=A0AAD4R3M7_9BILA|nr:hypothetical protein DdX_05711 [Ditylenchus destructor]